MWICMLIFNSLTSALFFIHMFLWLSCSVFDAELPCVFCMSSDHLITWSGLLSAREHSPDPTGKVCTRDVNCQTHVTPLHPIISQCGCTAKATFYIQYSTCAHADLVLDHLFFIYHLFLLFPAVNTNSCAAPWPSSILIKCSVQFG